MIWFLLWIVFVFPDPRIEQLVSNFAYTTSSLFGKKKRLALSREEARQAGTANIEQNSPRIPDNLRPLLLGEAKVLRGFELIAVASQSINSSVRSESESATHATTTL